MEIIMTSGSAIGYRITKAPFHITFLRDSNDVLSLSTPYDTIDVNESEHFLRVTCDQAVLSITFQDDCISLRWEGENVKNCFLMEACAPDGSTRPALSCSGCGTYGASGHTPTASGQ
jgi:hypothetical protein